MQPLHPGIRHKLNINNLYNVIKNTDAGFYQEIAAAYLQLDNIRKENSDEAKIHDEKNTFGIYYNGVFGSESFCCRSCSV